MSEFPNFLFTETRKAIAAYAKEVEKSEVSSVVIINHSVPLYQLEDQKELLRQAASMGIVPQVKSIEWDKELMASMRIESCHISVADVIAQYAKTLHPLVSILEKKREQAFERTMSENGSRKGEYENA